MVLPLFKFWYFTGRDAGVLVELWSVFNYDMALLNDFGECLRYLEWLEFADTLQESFGIAM